MQSELKGHCKYRKKWSDSKAARKEKELEQRQRRKEEEKRECEEKFGKVLEFCKGLVSKTVKSGGVILDLLDPLVSDNQCQIHGVLLCNILSRFYNSDGSSRCDTEMLEDKDEDVLSHAVLLSLLKNEYRDKLGFVVKDILTTDFDGSILATKKRERYYINEAKVKFNSYSVDFIRSFARGSIGEILNECQAMSQRAPLKLLPLYATMSAVINYIETEKLPMVVSIWQYVRQGKGEDATYSLHNDEVRFYEFREEKEEFIYKPELNDSEKEKPAIVFACYSLTNGAMEKLPTDYQTTKNLLMSYAASTRQLPKTAVFPGEYADGDEYARALYERHTDFFDKYNEHYELAKKIDIVGARYAEVAQTSQHREDGSSSLILTVDRSERDIFFALDHVFLSSYSHESQYQRSLDVNSQVNQSEVLEIEVKKVIPTEISVLKDL